MVLALMVVHTLELLLAYCVRLPQATRWSQQRWCSFVPECIPLQLIDVKDSQVIRCRQLQNGSVPDQVFAPLDLTAAQVILWSQMAINRSAMIVPMQHMSVSSSIPGPEAAELKLVAKKHLKWHTSSQCHLMHNIRAEIKQT
jgi:hypothetical protein